MRRWEVEKILKRNILISVSCPPCFGWIRLRILDLKKEYIPLPTQLLIFSSISFSTSSPPSILAFKPPNLRASSIEHPVSSIEYPESSIEHLVSKPNAYSHSPWKPSFEIRYSLFDILQFAVIQSCEVLPGPFLWSVPAAGLFPQINLQAASKCRCAAALFACNQWFRPTMYSVDIFCSGASPICSLNAALGSVPLSYLACNEKNLNSSNSSMI